MDINEFIEKFAEAIEMDDSSALTPETEFHNLSSWDSLSGLSIIAMFDEEFDKALDGKQLKETRTLNELFLLTR